MRTMIGGSTETPGTCSVWIWSKTTAAQTESLSQFWILEPFVRV